MMENTATYGRARAQRAQIKVVSDFAQWEITGDTALVDVQTASDRLKKERGVSLCPDAIRRRCAAGKWTKGVFWVKPAGSYAINLEAVYQAIGEGRKI
jgi:hypothetical protein